MPVNLDPDTRAVVALLEEALTDSGMTQAEFAAALGTSGSRFSTYRSGRTKPTAVFCVRARRIGRALATARSSRLMSAPATAIAIREAGDDEWAWRMLLQGRDHLRLLLEREDGSAAAWEASAPTTNSPEIDTLLAALTQREFDSAGVEPPAWAAPTPLPQPWVPAHPFLDREQVIARTPDFLRVLNLFVPARDLATA